jgi:hypothetical protein
MAAAWIDCSNCGFCHLNVEPCTSVAKEIPACTCGRIQIGHHRAPDDAPRNLSPDCPEHGDEAKRREDELFGKGKS